LLGLCRAMDSLQKSRGLVPPLNQLSFALPFHVLYFAQQLIAPFDGLAAPLPVRSRSPASLIGILIAERVKLPLNSLQIVQQPLLDRQYVQQPGHVTLFNEACLPFSDLAQLLQDATARVDQIGQSIGMHLVHSVLSQSSSSLHSCRS
jgi:hypothetical protein